MAETTCYASISQSVKFLHSKALLLLQFITAVDFPPVFIYFLLSPQYCEVASKTRGYQYMVNACGNWDWKSNFATLIPLPTRLFFDQLLEIQIHSSNCHPKHLMKHGRQHTKAPQQMALQFCGLVLLLSLRAFWCFHRSSLISFSRTYSTCFWSGRR